MKVMVFYLPQFHETMENNRWWGKGYTEWVGVREARPLYPGHYQPTEPASDNYYDLTNPETLRWQAKLAKENEIYGFCFYHYWFGRKLILEKPAQLLLENKDIQMNFCFSWANETWKRTWSRQEGNSWNVVYDEGMPQQTQGILMKQEYGDRSEWHDHFMYFLPFFQDERYIKVDHKPVLILYKPREIKCLHAMLKMWNQLAVESGFAGLYIIATNDWDVQNPYIEANVIFEPAYSVKNPTAWRSIVNEYVYKKREKGRKIPLIYSYSHTWEKILSRQIQSSRKTFLGGFVKFDKTPREGKNASLYLGASPEKFKKYFNRLVQMGKRMDHEFVFLNAWNEWGEGAYLEPDKKYGKKYLYAVRDVMRALDEDYNWETENENN